MSPFLRFVLVSATLVIGLPLAFAWGVIWLPNQIDCVPLAWDASASMRYRAYSSYLDGELYSPRNPHRRPKLNKEAMNANLEMRTESDAYQVRAWNDVSYVSCDLDESERSALIGFSEFRDGRLAQLLALARTGGEAGQRAREVLARAVGDGFLSPADPRIIAPDQLLPVLARYPAWYPHWLPADYAAESRSPYFTSRGLLAQGDLPEQVFWVTFLR